MRYLNVGTVANDGTGQTLRSSMILLNKDQRRFNMIEIIIGVMIFFVMN